jgi:uncharacterized protein
MSARPPAHVNPRSPFALDTRELGRRPGSMIEVHRAVAAPSDWQLELVSVPTGAAVELDLRLESVMEGVLVSAEVRAPLAAECGRCLEPVTDLLEVSLAELFSYEVDADDDEAPVLDGDIIDLEPTLRDAVVLALPINPVCDEDCLGLCVTCGERLADLAPDHGHAVVDPRWAALSDLTDLGGRATGGPDIAPSDESSATMDDATGKDPAASRIRES